MTSPRLKLAAGAVVLVCAFVFATTPRSQAQEPEGNFGVGIPEVFLPKYLAYREGQLASSAPDVMRIPLGYVKGLSTSFTSMAGEATINLRTGAFQVSLTGLTPLQTYTVWLLDRTETDFVPPWPDIPFGLVTFLAVGPSARLTGLLPFNLPVDLTIDRVVVAPGLLFGSEALGAGSVNVFQKIFFHRLSLVNDSTGAVLFEETTPAPPLAGLVPDLAGETDALLPPILPPVLGLGFAAPDINTSSGSSNRSVKLDRLISQGAELFFEETFRGNGRTCGTCHRANRNFMIDAEFITTLPANDPLFVAEFNPVLKNLERPLLMREFGLILENLDGLSNPTTKFVMRGVPHTLGLQVSLARDTGLVPPAPAEMTGWSGDGAPETGSLRDFAIGAVTQHFTKRLQRVEGTDFRRPKEHQLDALEAFQLSLGRDKDFNLAKITFAVNVNNLNTNPKNVNRGKALFINGGDDLANFGGTCNFCHTNGGALSASLQNQNRNFNTNVEDREHPARDVQTFPRDGGFGQALNSNGAFGNETFNTPSVVEAADTPPFFHNNVEVTLENAVRFYTGPEFNNPRAPSARFSFTDTQINQISNFLRGINTLQNIDVARRELQEILSNNGNPRREQDTRLQTAFEETQNSINVLNEGGIFPSAVTHLTAARNFISQAQVTESSSQRRSLIQQAITRLGQAKAAVATIAP